MSKIDKLKETVKLLQEAIAELEKSKEPELVDFSKWESVRYLGIDIQRRDLGKYKDKSLYLDISCNWEIVIDESGTQCLIAKKKHYLR